MQHLKIYFSIIVFALTAGVTSAVIKTMQRASLMSEAQITMEHARNITLRRVEGTIADSDLERKHGRAVYEFEFEPVGCFQFEVRVDAVSGEIIRVRQERRKVGEWERECREEDSDDDFQLP